MVLSARSCRLLSLGDRDLAASASRAELQQASDAEDILRAGGVAASLAVRGRAGREAPRRGALGARPVRNWGAGPRRGAHRPEVDAMAISIAWNLPARRVRLAH
jgi:hypothetical protein